MKLEPAYVSCAFEGDVHANVSDPMVYGPVYQADLQQADYLEAWTVRDDKEYGPGLAHFTCPGPHRQLWIGKEV
jgi:hypothetical protein